MRPLIIDNFAGGGGASTGLEAAFGRPVDVAINHDEAAIAVHAANHPETRHLCQSIMSIDPMDATEGKPTLLVWFSPDCKHHSKAKGGKPREKNIRDLAWIVPHWIERLKKATPNGRGAPLVIRLANVEEFRDWGPLDAEGKPIRERKGEEFKLWVARIRRLGYKVEWRELRACDYGGEVLPAAPTSRKRLFLIARRDGRPIVWPTPTHGKPDTPDVLSGKLRPWRTAAECIDWSIPCPSIFDRKKPLEEATCRRIAAGVKRYVVNSARPFIVPVTNKGWNPGRTWSADEPLRTITTARGGEFALAQPSIIPVTHSGGDRVHSIEDPFRTITGANRGELAIAVPHLSTMRNAQKPFAAADEPMHTITANGAHKQLVSASLLKLRRNSAGEDPAAPLGVVTTGGLHHGIAAGTLVSVDNTSTRASRSFDVEDPLRTVTASGGGYAAIDATMVQTGYGEREGQAPRALEVQKPLGTIVAGGAKHAAVAAFLHKYRQNSEGADAAAPMPTVTANSFVKRGGGAPPISIATAHIEQANGGFAAGAPGHDARKPLSTIVGKGCTQRVVETTMVDRDALPPELMTRAVQVAAFLIKYYGNEGDGHGLDAPIGTVTTLDRFAVVTVTIDAVTFVLVDIGMRMLKPRELANAQGFPADYILDPTCWYRTDKGNLKHGPLPLSHQIAKIGNSVCPNMAEVLARANLPEHCTGYVPEESAAA